MPEPAKNVKTRQNVYFQTVQFFHNGPLLLFQQRGKCRLTRFPKQICTRQLNTDCCWILSNLRFY